MALTVPCPYAKLFQARNVRTYAGQMHAPAPVNMHITFQRLCVLLLSRMGFEDGRFKFTLAGSHSITGFRVTLNVAFRKSRPLPYSSGFEAYMLPFRRLRPLAGP